MAARRYVEPARTYVSSLALLVILVAGYLFDLLALGGGRVHALAWLIGAAIVIGFDALIVHAARSVRSIVVTDDEVRVGDDAVQRADIAGVRLGIEEGLHVLGRRGGEGMPRQTAPLTLQLTDGTAIVVATRHPQRLAEVLGAEEVLPELRPADAADLEQLPEIDSRADSLFRVAGMDVPDVPYPVDALHDAKAVFVAGRPAVAFVQVDEVGGIAHVQELAVLPSHMRQGLGSALLDTACTWARDAGYPAITLTTYAEVPWNAPFYAARGFVELTELTPELAELRDWERDIGLDSVGRRVAMRREL
ncbi:MAG TPA: GNAT family N-acetyltransferase [Jatrophihabitantaceae bacterium]|nr:GNAT family N-acetyltransferase [Jatrophihabitantaceae bacterium]